MILALYILLALVAVGVVLRIFHKPQDPADAGDMKLPDLARYSRMP